MYSQTWTFCRMLNMTVTRRLIVVTFFAYWSNSGEGSQIWLIWWISTNSSIVQVGNKFIWKIIQFSQNMKFNFRIGFTFSQRLNLALHILLAIPGEKIHGAIMISQVQLRRNFRVYLAFSTQTSNSWITGRKMPIRASCRFSGGASSEAGAGGLDLMELILLWRKWILSVVSVENTEGKTISRRLGTSKEQKQKLICLRFSPLKPIKQSKINQSIKTTPLQSINPIKRKPAEVLPRFILVCGTSLEFVDLDPFYEPTRSLRANKLWIRTPSRWIMGGESVLELFEFFKQGWHSVFWVLLVPVTIILVGPAVRPAQAMHQFTFHRMQHYEQAGNVRGNEDSFNFKKRK